MFRRARGIGWLWLGAIAASFGCGERSSRADEPTSPPSFLVILSDDLGYGDLGCFGHPSIQTPHLNQLAVEGARLTDCYSAAPVCSPSRVGLLTGRAPTRAGVYDWIPAGHPMHLRAGEPTIASLLKEAGYDTCHVGKWHCNGKFNSPDQPQPGDHGFDHWFSTQNNAGPSHANPRNFVRNGRRVGPLKGYSCQLVAGEALDWLRRRPDPARPFFLFVCFHEPHEPIASPPNLVARYSDATKPGQAEYFANVTNLDRAVGRLLAGLDELKLAERTVVFFTSDNGPETLNRYRGAERSHGSPGPLRGMKLHVYEGGIRVPGILRWPGLTRPGQVISEPIGSVDLLPTFCKAAGVALPAGRHFDGTDFSPALAGRSIRRATPLFWHYFRATGLPKVALRDGAWKVLGHWDGPQLAPGASVHPGDQEAIKSAKLTAFEVYNLGDDLTEKQDRAAAETGRLEKLSGRLRDLYHAIVAEGPVWPLPAAAGKSTKNAD